MDLSFLSDTALQVGAWDLNGFLKNAASYVKVAGGALLILMGVAGVVWGGVLLVKKLMMGQQGGQGTGWGQIIGLILIGGALAVGGWNFMSTISGGGQQTILDMGKGGMILPLLGLG